MRGFRRTSVFALFLYVASFGAVHADGPYHGRVIDTAIDQYLTNIVFVEQRGLNIEYEMIRAEGPDQASYMVLFVVDEDGIWRIKFF